MTGNEYLSIFFIMLFLNILMLSMVYKVFEDLMHDYSLFLDLDLTGQELSI